VRSPGLCAILDLVQDFLPGGDLYSLLRGVRMLDEASTRIFMAQVVLFLHSLHEGGATNAFGYVCSSDSSGILTCLLLLQESFTET
jgi:hypothetical protein